ncbi:ribonuclease H-like domain-containing protein [Tanacetum coccineum]
MKIPIIRKGEYDIWSMRMRQYICHTDHNLWDVIVNGDLEEEPTPTGETSAPPAPKTAKQLFHNVANAKSLWEAIKSRFRGNEKSKKMQKNVLKHQFENFSTASNESLDKAYDRFQKLISQLEVHGAPISKEDINQKFLRSLPPSWNQIALIMRNKPDIDEIDIDDLYKNLRVYEDEMKRSSFSTSTSQNLAFLSSENTSSTNEVSTASGDFGVSTAGGISQIDEDDLEELDLRWQVAMLTVRCYNCHRKGHFARDCRSRRNQGKRSYGDNGRSNAPTNESSSQALVAQDGLGGYDWSNDFEVEPVNYALMAISSSSSSSSSDNEVQKCSKQCLESFKTLQKNYDSEREKHSISRLEIQGYELALELLESRILVYEKNELACEKVVKERDELKLKIEKLEESSKNLDELLNSQMSARDKIGLGYGTQLNEMSNNSKTDSEISLSVFDVRSSDEENTPANDSFSKVDGFHAVPPPITGNFLNSRADISFVGLDEYAIRKKIIKSKTTDLNTKTSETVGKINEANTQKPKTDYELVNRDKVIIEDRNLDDEDDVSESQEPKLKTVVNTGLRVDKPVWDNTKRVNHQKISKYPHLRKTFVLSGVLTRTCLITSVKQNEKRAVHKVSTAWPVNTARPVSTARPISTVRPFAPKIAQTSGAIRPIYPRMDNVRPRGSYSPIRRAVVNTSKGKMDTDLKKSRWVWRPKGNYLDHVSKDNGSFMLKKGNPEILLHDHVVVDSGCSSHMTGNKAYLSDYEDYNEGFVAFGSDPKGDEFKFNLFSVSQMYDKKNSVLFTKTECLILSPSFKLIDESQVVLRAPRKDDVYILNLKNIVPSRGMKRELSVARTPQQNGVAERKNRTLIEAARTMLADSLLPIPFWAEAVNTVCYVLNRVLVTKPQNKTPYELLIVKSPSISFMRPFGCPLTILNTLDFLGKFDGKSVEGYLLGYSTTSKAFGVYNKMTKRVEENLHIDFLEDQPNVAGTGPNWMFDLDFLTNSMNYIPVSVENQVNVDAGTQDSYVAGSSGKDKEPTQEYILLPLHPHRTRIPVEDVAPAAHEKPSESSSKDNDGQYSEDVANKEGQHQMTEDEQVLHDELEKMIAQEVVAKALDDATRQAFEEEKRNITSQKRAAQATSINKLSTGRSSVSTATTPYVSTASTPTGANADLPIDPNMPDLEDDSDAFSNDGIFNGAYDDENVGAVADFNNMDDSINVSLIPTLIIHKDYPKDQILGNPKSAVQTRGKIQKAS